MGCAFNRSTQLAETAADRNIGSMSKYCNRKFGEPSAFQIECIHEPIPNSRGNIFGRMCLRFDNDVLGDLDEPTCMLNVTAAHLQDILNRLGALEVPELFALTDSALWERLDTALYRDDNRTEIAVAADAQWYSRFDLLTNGGESFDKSKSFIVVSESQVRILFDDADRPLVRKTVDRRVFVETLQSFLAWVEGGSHSHES